MISPDCIDQPIYRFIVRQKSPQDPRFTAHRKNAHALGLTSVSGITCEDLYFIRGNLTQAQLERIANQLLHDPVIQTI